MSRASDRRGRPAPLVALALIVGLEAVVVAVLGLLVVFAALTARNPVSGVAAGLTLLLLAALLAAVAVGTSRARPWTRSAALVWQVVQLLVGLYAFQGGANVVFALGAIAPAVVALVLLFTAPVREATARR